MSAVNTYRIPFNRPTRAPNDAAYVEQALAGGALSGDGPFTKRCHAIIERELGVHKAMLTTSCTHALEMAALLLDIKPGDEVIVPSFTFVSSVNAFVLRGARPVFADIRPDTLGIDERQVARLITPRTRALVAVHYAGVACEMDTLNTLMASAGAAVIEDNAHGLFGFYKGRPLGTLGRMATLSFHETKNVTCGEGGALLLNDPALAERAEIVREKGTDRSRFFRGEVDKYGWVDLGSSYLPSDILAAMLCSQLEHRSAIQERRRALWHRYRDALAGWAASQAIALPVIPDWCEQSYHMFYLMPPTIEIRDRLVARLKAQSMLAVSHYVPLHLSKGAAQFGAVSGACPVTEHVASRLLRLPFYTSMTDDEQSAVIRELLGFA